MLKKKISIYALAFAMIPFGYAKRTIGYYESHIQEDLETALSIVTTSYIRNDDIVTAFKENLEHLKPPVKDIFAGFIADGLRELGGIYAGLLEESSICRPNDFHNDEVVL